MPPDQNEEARVGTGPLLKSDNHADTESLSPSTALVAYDWRVAARSTEYGLEPIDHALTATGLAAELKQLAERIGRPT